MGREGITITCRARGQRDRRRVPRPAGYRRRAPTDEGHTNGADGPWLTIVHGMRSWKGDFQGGRRANTLESKSRQASAIARGWRQLSPAASFPGRPGPPAGARALQRGARTTVLRTAASARLLHLLPTLRETRGRELKLPSTQATVATGLGPAQTCIDLSPRIPWGPLSTRKTGTRPTSAYVDHARPAKSFASLEARLHTERAGREPLEHPGRAVAAIRSLALRRPRAPAAGARHLEQPEAVGRRTTRGPRR